MNKHNLQDDFTKCQLATGAQSSRPVGLTNGAGKGSRQGMVNGNGSPRNISRASSGGVVNGGMTNGLRGIPNSTGLTNGSGVVNGGLTNGLGKVNDRGMINGNGAFAPTKLQYHKKTIFSDTDWSKQVLAAALVALLAMSPLLIHSISSPSPLRIDGYFGDWDEFYIYDDANDVATFDSLDLFHYSH